MSVKGRLQHLAKRLRQYLIMLPWLVLGFVMRVLYGFRVEGAENLPSEGAHIVLQSEFGMICFLLSGWSSIMLLRERFFESPDRVVSYMQEQLFAFSYFRGAADQATFIRALIPHSAGRLALSLLDGYRVLRRGGLVLMNPEGDMRWDGRPLPIGAAAAWLGLHTAAPIVPVIPSASAYDIWPRWKMVPSLRGRVVLRVGQPFRLCDTPQERVTDQDLERASARIREGFDELRYGPEGLDGWIGPPRRNGVPPGEPVRIHSRPELAEPRRLPIERDGPVWKRGMTLVLWRCPVCGTDDALVHQRPWFGQRKVSCQACETRWKVNRVIGKDFRLEVVAGPPDLMGLNMALSTWYDQMMQGFEPSPVQVSGVDLSPDEEVYLEAHNVSLSPHRPNALFEERTGREPPKTQPPDRPQLGDWPSIGEGRLLLTNRRLHWSGPVGELDFRWSSVTAVYLWLINTLAVKYGSAPYRFSLEREVGLKWLTYASTMAQRAAEADGHAVTTSAF